MTTVRHILRKQADLHSVRFWIVEKDYALSYLIAGISATDDLGDALVLKGGTALRKLYFKDYRFSEDLDYSTRQIGPISEMDAKLDRAIKKAEELLQEKGPFRIEYEPLALREPHPEGQAPYVVRVQFPHHRAPVCRLKVEITIDEPIFLEPVRRPILHDFPESMSGEMAVYSLEEIVAEKLRALLQSLSRIEDRGWGTGRVPRDYYDLWYLLKHVDLSGAQLVDLTRRKSIHRNVDAKSADDFFSPPLQEIARRQWEKQLRIFVPTAPPAEVVLEEARTHVRRLWQ
jgi:predicted nucleotidyltransferase component of viral defense system